MKKKLALIAVIVVVFVASVLALFTALPAVADRPPSIPHDGDCVAYCARAYPKAPSGAYFDGNGNGHQENCLVEGRCHHESRNPALVGQPPCDADGMGCSFMPSCVPIHGPNPGPVH